MAQTTQVMKMDVPELKVIEKSKAEQIRSTFAPMYEMLKDFEARYDEIIKEAKKGITPELSAKAKRFRIDVGKIRIETGRHKDNLKEKLKLEDKAIMGVHNILVWAVKEMEDNSKEIERDAEIQEQKRKAELQSKRAELLSKYVEDAHERNLADFDEDVWSAYLSTKKKEYEDRIEAEKKAEAERVEAQRKQDLYIKRKDSLIKEGVIQFIDLNELTPEMTDVEFGHLVDAALQAKRKHEAEQERIRKENARLEAERKEVEKKAAQERAEAEKKLKAEREQREAAERKAEAERKALQDKLDQQEKERKEREAAEAKAKEQMLKKGDSGKWEQIIISLTESMHHEFKSKDNKAEYLEMVNTWKSQINTIERLLK